MPMDLCDEQGVREELTLWKSMTLFLKYPEIKNSPNRQRHEYSFVRLIEKVWKGFSSQVNLDSRDKAVPD